MIDIDTFPIGNVEILDKDAFWKDFFETKYQSQIRAFVRKYPSEKSLTVSYNDIWTFGRNGIMYADALLTNPDETLRDINDCLKTHELIKKKGEVLLPPVRITGLPRKKAIHEIREADKNTFVSIEGTVSKITNTRPRLTVGVYRCPRGHRTTQTQPYGHEDVPEYCSADGCTQRKLKLVDSLSTSVDSQKIRIQEHQDGLPGGAQPQVLDVELTDDLTNQIYPGNRVIINGIVRKYRPVTALRSTVFQMYIEANSFEITEKEFAEIEIEENEERDIIELSKNPDIYDMIARSVAPTIYGQDELKKAFGYLLFGGSSVETNDGGRTRGDIHILLIGEPGIAKSELLRRIVKISPRGVYTSGRGSTAAGLTAAVVKDDFGDKAYTMEAGALPHADKGVCVIDEIAQIDSRDLSTLHEAMEQQYVDIHKGGIHAVLQTRCSVIGAANPKNGWLDDVTPLKEQIKLPGPIMSRFDLIFILRDNADPGQDNNIARHIIGVRSGDREKLYTPDISPELLRKYIAYSHRLGALKWMKPAEDYLAEYYVTIRGLGGRNENKPVPLTPRQLNAAARLSEASARIRLSPKVEKEDVMRAIKILDACLKQVAYDPRSGVFDIGIMEGGKSKKQTDVAKAIREAIKELADGSGRANRDAVILKLSPIYGGKEIVETMVKTMLKEMELIEPKTGLLKVI
jgi:replicative DNA helicase Mcm